MKIILASQSPARLALLKTIGIEDVTVIPADIDETEQKGEKPHHLALRLATEKCAKIAANHPDDIVIAADSVICLGTRLLPKALSDDDVRLCLKMLSGKRHRAYTGVTISKGEEVRSKVAMTTIKFKRLTSDEIEEYVATKEGLNKAGGYSIQGFAQCFIPFISGKTSNVVGLPLFETKNMLLSLGYKFNRSK